VSSRKEEKGLAFSGVIPSTLLIMALLLACVLCFNFSSPNSQNFEVGQVIAENWIIADVQKHSEFCRLVFTNDSKKYGLEIDHRKPHAGSVWRHGAISIQPHPEFSLPPENVLQKVESLFREPPDDGFIGGIFPESEFKNIENVAVPDDSQTASVWWAGIIAALLSLVFLWLALHNGRKIGLRGAPGHVSQLILLAVSLIFPLLICASINPESTNARPENWLFFLLAILPLILLAKYFLQWNRVQKGMPIDKIVWLVVAICSLLMITLHLDMWSFSPIFNDDADRNFVKALMLVRGIEFPLRGALINDGVFYHGPLFTIITACMAIFTDNLQAFSYLNLPLFIFTMLVVAIFLSRCCGTATTVLFCMIWTTSYFVSQSMFDLYLFHSFAHGFLPHGFIALMIIFLWHMLATKNAEYLAPAALALAVACQVYALNAVFLPVLIIIPLISKISFKTENITRAIAFFVLPNVFTIGFFIVDQGWNVPFSKWLIGTVNSHSALVHSKTTLYLLAPLVILSLSFMKKSLNKNLGKVLCVCLLLATILFTISYDSLRDKVFAVYFPLYSIAAAYIIGDLLNIVPFKPARRLSNLVVVFFMILFSLNLIDISREVKINQIYKGKVDLHAQENIVDAMKRHGLTSASDYQTRVHSNLMQNEELSFYSFFLTDDYHYRGDEEGLHAWVTTEDVEGYSTAKFTETISVKNPKVNVLMYRPALDFNSTKCTMQSKTAVSPVECMLPNRTPFWSGTARMIATLVPGTNVPEMSLPIEYDEQFMAQIRYEIPVVKSDSLVLRIHADNQCKIKTVANDQPIYRDSMIVKAGQDMLYSDYSIKVPAHTSVLKVEMSNCRDFGWLDIHRIPVNWQWVDEKLSTKQLRYSQRHLH